MAQIPPPPGLELGSDLDLRLVRYFTVVADHLNFGRAAAALHVAQPSLSRQIQRLEDQLGVRLLDRTPQGSRLTEAGEAFLPRAQGLLHSAHEATFSARAAAPEPAITIGYVEDLVIAPAVRDLRRRRPDAEIRTRHLDPDDARAALPEHRVDALVARMPLPFETDRLRVTVLYEESRVLAVPSSHRLAAEDSVTVEDFADEALVSCIDKAAGWRAFWRLEPRPDGRPAPVGPIVIESFEDKLELVADGQAIAILPAGDRRSSWRRDIATIPIEGVDPCQVVVATRADDDDRVVVDFLESARNHLTVVAPLA
jgi:DNA-binding transcriptional LysR family regulator